MTILVNYALCEFKEMGEGEDAENSVRRAPYAL
jgi:hypothetical protein